ncbi:alpha/beta hydrolase [Clostridium isatidis]|uniref:Phospholipase/carboxylesterase/thioesterase domain-containing protein n=1 Tax=Clostridium isatidis TaxID=182773 RepID=A0A343JEA2_9CLOT|nr:alpha/beta hydrolase [Clostridium isatidis]ASW43860.1 hypothetical protein BEN51_10295 [Clostridium isatidis]
MIGIEVSGEFIAYIQGDDWGCGVSKIVISLDKEIDTVSKESFKVEETKEAFDWARAELGLRTVKRERRIEDAYTSDEFGRKIEGASKYITILMNFTPYDGNYLLFSPPCPYNRYPSLYKLDISIADGEVLKSGGKEILEFKIDPNIKSYATSADKFKTANYKAKEGIEYKYAYYEPEEKTKNLVVWLHGLGEGGLENTDPYLTCLANKVPALIEDKFQKLMNKANILVPQCPTFWMDNTGRGIIVDYKIEADGTSYYTKSLFELINYYKEKTASEKVIIAGCSNGGYMALLLALEYGRVFDGYVLICEAMEDKYISDEKIEAIKDLPLYFIYSKDDPVVAPKSFEIPTIKRLREAKASNLHVASFDKVIDTRGRFNDDEGNPYNYGGHASWIYFFNNEAKCDECGIDVWSWMAEQ